MIRMTVYEDHDDIASSYAEPDVYDICTYGITFKFKDPEEAIGFLKTVTGEGKVVIVDLVAECIESEEDSDDSNNESV